ncbi:GntR family transcriptional regulator [Variovorax rhizosphaerae]|uniref:GntR family transcriptional regulator n=1 Tax=Variovorax rhizosphaerae TaxID=1836200 RepID=A0ABU8WMZ5_9BURK
MKSIDAESAPDEGAAQPLSEMAYQAVMAMLVSGELAPNEVVTERQIATRLGVSRTPLREATRRLEGERFLERQRSGVLVVRPLPIEEFMHILAVRKVLEGEAARLAAGHIEKELLQSLRRRITELRDLPEGQPLPPAFVETDRDLHLLIAAASANPVLQQMIEDLRKRLAMVRFGRTASRRVAVCDEHIAIIDALISGDGEAARQAMQLHIERVRAVILERLGGR